MIETKRSNLFIIFDISSLLCWHLYNADNYTQVTPARSDNKCSFLNTSIKCKMPNSNAKFYFFESVITGLKKFFLHQLPFYLHQLLLKTFMA